MGAWIETAQKQRLIDAGMVASYMGAWIETLVTLFNHRLNKKSHPTWVRGLKRKAEADAITAECRILHGCVD